MSILALQYHCLCSVMLVLHRLCRLLKSHMVMIIHNTKTQQQMQNLDWHHSWNNWTGDADIPAVTDKVDKHVHLKEQLCNNEVSTSINLLLEVLQVLLVGWTVWMTSWIS